MFMSPSVCRCCGGLIPPSDQGVEVLVCKDCERLTEDDSPSVTALALQALVTDGDDKAETQTPTVEKAAAETPAPLHLEEPKAR